MQTAGFENVAELTRLERHVFYRARRAQDERAVLLKTPISEPPLPSHTEALERERGLLRDLGVDGLLRPLDFFREGGRGWLVLEDVPGATPLAGRIGEFTPDPARVLDLGVRVTALLAALHRRDICHRALTPASLLVGPQGVVHLADLTFAHRPTDAQSPIAGQLTPYWLRYLAPEQTGRMNRAVDHRADFYALGIILYELLTGAAPFRSDDVLELVHWHLARPPKPAREVRPDVPEAVSTLVSKLLAKNPDERYQSAVGLQRDLERCAAAWAAGRGVPAFPLGERDVSEAFLIPQRLYGRERDLETLSGAFVRACAGRASLVLVAGYAGIGKTSLIQELYRPLVRRRGYFAAGKFDQVAGGVPFAALVQAFRGLLRQLLAEDEDRLAAWRAVLDESLGAGAAVLAEVLPEVALILGPQPAPPPVDAAEARNRFVLALQRFLGAIARADHPLVLFLDDLQWADAATLALLEPLLTSAEATHLLLIGAYRDNEVDAAHPLLRAVEEVDAAGVPLQRMELGPLRFEDLARLVRDTLRCGAAEAEPLARLVAGKTGGNPFFVIQFLKALHRERLVAFDHEARRWTFSIDAIAGAALTDNVVDLMARKIQRLGDATQHTLTLAGCVGGEFDLETLAITSEQPPETVAAHLREAIDEGLVLGSTPRLESVTPGPAPPVYRFLHDRVQQAARALIPESQRQLVHLTIGRLMRRRHGTDAGGGRLFDVVRHLNLGGDLIDAPEERLALAGLNLEASRRAKASTAYGAAAGYADRGLELLTPAHWESDPELLFALHLGAAESHYLAGRFDAAERHFGLLLSRPLAPRDKAQVHALRIVLYENQSRYAQALASGRDGLALLGIVLPEAEAAARAALDAEIAEIDARLGGRAIASLIDLPVAGDPDVRMAMRILTSLWSPFYISGNAVVARLISAMLVRLSLQHGNSVDSAYGYVTHAITVGPVRGDYVAAHEWGELAIAIDERFGDVSRRAKVHQQFQAHVLPWRRPFAACIPHAREACRAGLEAGDLNYAGYGAVTETWPAFLIADDLDRFVREYEPAAALLAKLKLADFQSALRVMLNWALALLGRTAGPLSLATAQFDEAAFLARFERDPFFSTFFHTAKLHLSVLLEEREAALEAARRARQGSLAGTIWPVLVDFWGGLALTAAFDGAAAEDRAAFRDELDASERRLAVLAAHCPENYRCFHLLLSAEMHRIAAQPDEAERLCRSAIAYARQTGSVQLEALGNELGARAMRGRDGVAAAAPFLVEAHRGYAVWGAAVKTRQMEARHGRLLAARPAAAPADRDAAPAWSDVPRAAALDLTTVLKMAHAIAGEIRREDLLPALMTIALETAGAQRGFFLCDRDGRLTVEAEGTAEGGSALRDDPLDAVPRLAAAVVRYVRATGESVVVADAGADERFSQDPYIAAARPRSIISVPAVHQGTLQGILYLENNLVAGAFTPDRIAVLDVICAQAAISLENARLYRQVQQAEEMLRDVTEGTASATGAAFFPSLVQHLASALGVRYAFVTECRDRTRTRVRTLAFWIGDALGDNIEYDVAGTPCRTVIDGRECEYSSDLQRLFPADRELVRLNAQSYLGAPLVDAAGDVIGHLAVLDDRPMAPDPRASSILRICAARAGAELERVHAEERLRSALANVEELKNRLQVENVYLQEEIRQEHNFDEIMGSTPALLEMLRTLERAAPTDATVLVCGETGTGKELVARAIHDRSRRRQRALVKVNCGAISAGLVESELFGHVKGAFTGAIERRVGRFELADGGTLFLDEVSELPLETQVKLLRALQEQEFEPVGSSRTVRVDVRIIAATNRDLEEAVRAGRFRADLFFRLNVLRLDVPPLRERLADVPQLALYFLARFAKQFGKPMTGIARDTMASLAAYDWPGNVRELLNVIERAVVLADGPVLTLGPGLLPVGRPAAASAPHDGAPPRSAAAAAAGGSAHAPATLEEIERRHILEVLERTRGVIEGPAGAARVLDLHPNTLRSRMKKLGLQRPRH